MGIILNIIASILSFIFQPFFFMYSLSQVKRIEEWDKYNFDVAVSKDQLNNVRGQHFFNDVLFKEDGYKAGKPDETISSCIGKNKRKNTLTLLGKLVDLILNKIDNNHSIKSIEDDE